METADSPGLSKRQLLQILRELKVLPGNKSFTAEPPPAPSSPSSSSSSSPSSSSSSSLFRPLAAWSEEDVASFIESLGSDPHFARAASLVRNFGLDGFTLQTEYGEDNLMQLIANDLGFGEDNLAMQPVMRQVLVAHLSRLVASGGGVPPSMIGSATEKGNDCGLSTEDGEQIDDTSSLFGEDHDMSSFLSETSVGDGSEGDKSDDDPVIRIDDFMEALHLLRGQQRQPEPDSQRRAPSSVLSVQKRHGHNNEQERILTSIVHRIGGGYFCAQREILLPAGVQTRSDEPKWPISCEGSFDMDDLEVSFTPLAPPSSPPSPPTTKARQKVTFGRWHTVGYPRFRKPLALLPQDPNRRVAGTRNSKPNVAKYGEEDGYGFGGGFGRSNTAKGASSNPAQQGYIYRPTAQSQPLSPSMHSRSHHSGIGDAYKPLDEASPPPERPPPDAPSVVLDDETASSPPSETPAELFPASSMLGERFSASTTPISVIREEDEEDEDENNGSEEIFVSATMALWRGQKTHTTQRENSVRPFSEVGLERHVLLKQIFKLIDDDGDGAISREEFNRLGQLIAASSEVALEEGEHEGNNSTAMHLDEATFDELCGVSSEKVEESSPRLQNRLSFARFEGIFAASPDTNTLKRVITSRPMIG